MWRCYNSHTVRARQRRSLQHENGLPRVKPSLGGMLGFVAVNTYPMGNNPISASPVFTLTPSCTVASVVRYDNIWKVLPYLCAYPVHG